LAVFLVLLACGAFVLLKKEKPIYSASSVVYVSPKFPKMLASDSEVDLPYDSYFQDQIQKVARYDIIADAVVKLPVSLRGRSGPALPYEIQVLQNLLEVKRISSGYEMSIGLKSFTPNGLTNVFPGPTRDGLADIVNTVTETYVEKTKNEEFYGLDSRLETLHQEKERLQKEMEDRLAEQAKIMQELGVATISEKAGASNPYDSTSDTVRSQLATARMQRQAAEAQLAAVTKGDGPEGSKELEAAADDANATNATLSGMMGSLNSRKATLTQEMSGLRPDHPVYQKDKDEVASIDLQLSGLRQKGAKQLQDKLRQDVTRTRLIELQLTQELVEKTHTATSAAPKFQRATELGPEIDSLQKAYDAVADRIRDLELESSSPGSIHMSTKALTPDGPEKSKLPVFLLALILMSLTCAIAAPIGIDLLDGRIYTPQDVEKVVGFHPLGILLDNDEFRKEISGEYYFRLAAGIDHAVRNSGVKTFLFTSPAHGSGTSTVVKRLSEELRGLNLRTRTITASESEEFEVFHRDTPSRSDLLLQRLNKNDEIKPSSPTPIVAIYDHPDSRNRQEATTSNPVLRSLNQAVEQCDVVLIDANPLPISSTTEYLARMVDATVLVVMSSMTTKQELERAARLLERLEVAGVAVILNKISVERADRAMKKEFRSYEQSRRRRRAAAVKAAGRRTKTSA
jgi:capsular polysaccharide biosynthesis protein